MLSEVKIELKGKWHEKDGNRKGVIYYSDREEAQKQADYLNRIQTKGFERSALWE